VRLASRPRRTLEDLEAAAEIVRPVQDRLTYQIPVDEIHPSSRNPRQKIEGLDELASSLQEYGLLQPVVVRRVTNAYELIAGHRRLAAAKQLGWTQIAAVIRDETDDQAYLLTLTENLQREDLTPREEAAALEVLVRERGWTTRQVGEAIKRSHIYVSRRLRVFDDPILAPLVLERQLPVSTAEELLRVGDTDERKVLARRAVRERWERAQVRAVLEARAVRPNLERSVPNRTSHDHDEAPRQGVAGAELLAAALSSEIVEAWRLMHKWRA
jgi:ParB family chromosome partitioning protein